MNSDSKTTPTVVGIDIGANSSKVGVVRRGAIEILTNQANFRLTPSIVAYGDGQRKIGEAGNTKLKSNFRNTVVSPIRYLSLIEEEGWGDELQYCPCATEIQGASLTFKVSKNDQIVRMGPQEALATYLTHIKAIVENNGLQPKHTSIAVPSYFLHHERRAVLNAAEIAKIDNVVVVDQNVAVGLDYGVYKKNQFGEEGRTVIFVDFGHSKLSASALHFRAGAMEVLAQKHNRNLGCRNIDYKLCEYYSQIFARKSGIKIALNSKAYFKLLQVVQKQRKILTGIQEAEISIDCLLEQEDFCEQISRELMLKVAQGCFTALRNCLEEFKSNLASKHIPVEEVELLGGGTRVPAVIEVISQVFGVKPSRTINSSETIANGSTLSSVQLSQLFRLQTLTVKNRLCYPIKASWKSLQNHAVTTSIVCDCNQMLPFETQLIVQAPPNSQILFAYDLDEEHISPKIMRIQSAHNEIKVRLQISREGFFELLSVVSSHNQAITYKGEYFGESTQSHVDCSKRKEEEMCALDRQIIQGYEKKNQFQSYIFQQKEKLNAPELAQYFSEKDRNRISRYFEQLEEQMDDPRTSFSLEDYQQKVRELEELMAGTESIINTKRGQGSSAQQLQKLRQYAQESLRLMSLRYMSIEGAMRKHAQIEDILDWAVTALRRKEPISKAVIEQKTQLISSNMQKLKSQSEEYEKMGTHSRPFGFRFGQEHRQRRPEFGTYDPGTYFDNTFSRKSPSNGMHFGRFH